MKSEVRVRKARRRASSRRVNQRPRTSCSSDEEVGREERGEGEEGEEEGELAAGEPATQDFVLLVPVPVVEHAVQGRYEEAV